MKRRVFSDSFKEALVKEIESGIYSQHEAAKEYGVSKSHISSWLKDYGRFRPKHDILEVVMKSEQERIKELEQALAESHLKNRFYEKLIEVADEKYKTDLKKTVGTKLSQDLSLIHI